MNGNADAEVFKAFEAAGWSANADRYDRLTGRVSASVIEPLLDAAGVGRGTRVLDLGTGPGTMAAVAARRGARPVGVDLAKGMVEVARRLHPELEFVQGDAEALPFPGDGFDAAVAPFVVVACASMGATASDPMMTASATPAAHSLFARLIARASCPESGPGPKL